MRRLLILSAGMLVLIFTFGGCGNKSSKPEMTVLIRMMPGQEKYFTENMIPAFEKHYNCRVRVATWGEMWDIEATLKLEKGSRNPTVSLVKTPFEMTRVLVGKGYIKPIEEIMDTLRLDQDIAEYHQLALGLGYMDGKLYYIPRKLETRLLFYLKTKVKEAVAGWKQYEKELSKKIKKDNGYGLPAGYTLEEDPNQWDYYDMFVAGYYWSKTPYYKIKMPRVAFRGAKYGGTAHRMIDQSIQLGATHDDILQLNRAPIVRMFEWRSQLIKNNILNPAMWQDPMRGSHLWEGVRDGKVFMTIVQQIDCFFMHGWEGSIEIPGYMRDPGDMGLAVMPKAVSFGLTPKGAYQYEGDRKITSGGWWWGIPKTAPHPKLAYELARWITNHKNQADECSRFGMMPVRKDIINNLAGVFEEGWVGEIFRKSAEQLQMNELTTMPMTMAYSDIQRNYIDIWYAACVPGGKLNGPITDPAALHKALSGEFLDVQRRILGDDFPQ